MIPSRHSSPIRPTWAFPSPANSASALVLLILCAFTTVGLAAPPVAKAQWKRDDARGELWAIIDGKPAFCYRYGDQIDLPHFHPINSPAGKAMTVQQTEPYPHHRAFWFGDKVALKGQRAVETYGALYSGVKGTDGKHAPPFRDGVRHVAFDKLTAEGDTARARIRLLWFMDRTTPLLDEERLVRVRALGHGEYLIDVTFTVTAAYGDVAFTSDDVHYAWPYLRLNSEHAVPGGARITASSGPVSEAPSTKLVADWVDYSATTGGTNCGLAMFSHDDNAKPHRWLTRAYGTFGPRRIDARSGKPFTLAKGESLTRRVGLLVHTGDVETGHVAERYDRYVRGDL